ncbi:MAG: protein serine/threonine phosphatase [Bacteroidetes bacterium]|nr:protein serine/threonine phosphatase [Bacteroidota bacterium]
MLLAVFSSGFAQKKERPDSLLSVLKAARNDSVTANTCNRIAYFYIHSDVDSASKYLVMGRKVAVRNHLQKALSYNCTLTGNVNYWNGNTDTAFYYYSKALEIDLAIGDSSGLISDYIHLSKIYSSKGNIDKALDNLFKGLEIAKAIKDLEQEADCLFSLAVLYDRQDVPEKAIRFCENAITIQKQINDSAGMAYSYHRMGLAYEGIGKYAEALKYLEISFDIRKKMGSVAQYGASLNGIGLVYMDKGEYQKALKNFYDAYKYWSQANDKEGIVIASGNLGEISLRLGDDENALKFLLESYKLSDEIHSLSFQKGSARSIAAIYYRQGKYKLAYDYFNKYSDLRDTLFSDENSERVAQMQSKYESEQKEQKIKLLTQEGQLQQSEITKKKLILNAISIAAVLLVILIVMSFRNIRQKQKANKQLQSAYSEIEQKNERLIEVYRELEQNRDEVAGKNKEITDSIKYAKRLQEAILPGNDFITKLFPDSFVLYKPKDIVSGDFYWFEQWGNKKLFAAVDCTGHGVPGAFMSIVGYNQLNQAVNESGLSKPNLLLNALNKGVTKALKQTLEGSTVKDGMDIALCAYDESTGMLEFAGAYNSLWLVRNGKLTEVKADKKPIGVFIGEELKPFHNYEVKQEKGDCVYVFTDGYADQFGGAKGKKFKYKPLQQLLIGNQHLSMQQQKELLDTTIESWRGVLEQVDDILVIGIRI